MHLHKGFFQSHLRFRLILLLMNLTDVAVIIIMLLYHSVICNLFLLQTSILLMTIESQSLCDVIYDNAIM